MTVAPYPADTRAKGWRFEIDTERIRQSDTWALAKAEQRPWLLMLWMVAWEQTPCGSMPADDELIAARLGMASKIFAKQRAVLMRGWWLAEDGRLYHPVIAERVAEMVEYREKAAARKASYRERLQDARALPQDGQGSPADVPRDYHGTNGTGTGTGTKEEKETSVAIATAATAAHIDAAAAQIDRVEAVFTLGLPLLTAAGVPEKNARSFLGRLRKFNTDGAIVAAIDRCAKAVAAQPVEFLQGCLRTSNVHVNRQEALERSNTAIGDAWLRKEEADARQ